MRPVLEIAVQSVQDARAAWAAGADRLELCHDLGCGGLTPSPELFLQTRRRAPLPVVVLLRPRPGSFVYTPTEREALQRDMDLFLEHGAEAFAVGALDDDGRVAEACCGDLARRAAGRTLVFHRAFDQTARPVEALERIIDLGFERVLTSGQAPSALAGIDALRRLREHAADRIAILPGGGIRAANAAAILRATGCGQVHSSARQPGGGMDPREVDALRRAIDQGRC